MRKSILTLSLAALFLLCFSCQPDPREYSVSSPTPDASSSSTVSPSATPGVSTSASASPTATATPSISPSPTTTTAVVTVSGLKLTYYSNNASSGTVPTDSSSYTTGQKASIKPNSGFLLRAGYMFSGWNTQADGLGQTYTFLGSATLGLTNLNLYAYWVASPGTFKAACPGGNMSFYLKTDGGLWGVGSGYDGCRGDGVASSASSVVACMGNVAQVAAGSYSTLVLKTDGSLWGMGYNCYGQLMDGTTTDHSVPVQVMTGVSAVAISGSGDDTMVLKTDGTVWVAGHNDKGELGVGNSNSVPTPTQVMVGTTFQAISLSTGNLAHSMLLTTDGKVYVAGDNSYGELGIMSSNYSENSFSLLLSGIKAISCGGDFSLALGTDGTLYGMGMTQNFGYSNSPTTYIRDTMRS